MMMNRNLIDGNRVAIIVCNTNAEACDSGMMVLVFSWRQME
jgi:hypothetical protein